MWVFCAESFIVVSSYVCELQILKGTFICSNSTSVAINDLLEHQMGWQDFSRDSQGLYFVHRHLSFHFWLCVFVHVLWVSVFLRSAAPLQVSPADVPPVESREAGCLQTHDCILQQTSLCLRVQPDAENNCSFQLSYELPCIFSADCTSLLCSKCKVWDSEPFSLSFYHVGKKRFFLLSAPSAIMGQAAMLWLEITCMLLKQCSFPWEVVWLGACL